MKRVLLFAFVALVFVACNKNQAAVKKLDGKWTVTEMTYSDGGFSADVIALGGSASFTFTSCKLKKDEWCDGSSSVTYPAAMGGLTDNSTFLFRVTGDGTTMESKDSDTSSTITSMTIDELTKSDAKFTMVDGTATTKVTATKN